MYNLFLFVKSRLFYDIALLEHVSHLSASLITLTSVAQRLRKIAAVVLPRR